MKNLLTLQLRFWEVSTTFEISAMIFESLWLKLDLLSLKTKIFLGDLGKIANGYGVCLDYFLQGSSEIDSVESVLL